MKPIDREEISKHLFDSQTNDHANWWKEAITLLNASKRLADTCPLFSEDIEDLGNKMEFPAILEEGKIAKVALMLRGMAIECALKALWLKTGNHLSENGKYKKIPNTTEHDLDLMANELGKKKIIKLSGEDKEILKFLTHCIISGRYPTEKNVEQFKKKIKKPRLLFWDWKMDERSFFTLISKLRDAYHAIPIKPDFSDWVECSSGHPNFKPTTPPHGP